MKERLESSLSGKLIVPLLISVLTSCNPVQTCHLYFDSSVPQVKFTVDDLIHELTEKGLKVEQLPVSSFPHENADISVLVTHQTNEIEDACKLWDTTIPAAKKIIHTLAYYKQKRISR